MALHDDFQGDGPLFAAADALERAFGQVHIFEVR
jgi:hypothetical protein